MRRAGWALERQAWGSGFRRVAGLDEAGRGCLAGPVVAGAVILEKGFPSRGLRDSKQLRPAERERWYRVIRRHSRTLSFAVSGPDEIDRWNILEATRVAMRRAVAGLDPVPDILLIDAVRLGAWPATQVSISKGDEVSVSIAAASIIAKVERDRIMQGLDREYPEFHFRRNKGYPTREHRRALKSHGASPVHRRSFRPVREAGGGGMPLDPGRSADGFQWR